MYDRGTVAAGRDEEEKQPLSPCSVCSQALTVTGDDLSDEDTFAEGSMRGFGSDCEEPDSHELWMDYEAAALVSNDLLEGVIGIGLSSLEAGDSTSEAESNKEA